MCRCVYNLHTCILFVVVFVVCCFVCCYSQYDRVITNCRNNSLLTTSYWMCSLCPSRQVHRAIMTQFTHNSLFIVLSYFIQPFCCTFCVLNKFTLYPNGMAVVVRVLVPPQRPSGYESDELTVCSNPHCLLSRLNGVQVVFRLKSDTKVRTFLKPANIFSYFNNF